MITPAKTHDGKPTIYGYGQMTSHPHMDWGRQMAYINHFYFYLWDAEWGERSGRPTPMPPFPFGFGSTGMNGPSDS
jgi:hypothetical protein